MEVNLPPLGEGVTSGTVAGLFVKPGDKVQKNQPLLELESEKAVASIPAPADGVISEILVKEGDEIKVGQTIIVLVGEEPASEAREVKDDEPRGVSVAPTGQLVGGPSPESVPEVPVTPPSGFPPAAAPSIRKLARQLGLDLRNVKGSARGGRILMEDLRKYIHQLQTPSAVGAAPGRGEEKPETIDFSRWGPVTREKVSTLRQTISRRMAESWTTIPHVTQFGEADITDLQRLRKIHSPFYQKRGGRLTLTPFILKALVDTLKEFPRFNSSLDTTTNELVLKNYYDVGMAVDTDRGLIVPVIRGIDKKSLFDLSVEVGEIAQRTRDRKVSIEEMQGGTFTVSNQGGIGGGHFTPIINIPEVAILGIGKGDEKSVVRQRRPQKRMMIPLALSYDHRVVDGADAARFMTFFVDRLSQFKDIDVRLTS